MKGLLPPWFALLVAIFAAFLVLALVIGFYFSSIQKQTPTPGQPENIVVKPGSYDYRPWIQDTTTLLTQSDYSNYFSDQTRFCRKLKSCLISSIKNEKECLIDKISFGDYPNYLPFVLPGQTGAYIYCNSEELTDQIIPTIGQKVCNFDALSNIDLKSVSDIFSLYYDGTDLQTEAETISGKQTISEDFSPSSSSASTYYSPQYLHSGSLYPGRLKFYIGKSAVDNGKCKYTLRIAYKPFLASEEADSTLDVFDAIRTLGIVHYGIAPYYIRDASKQATKILDKVNLFYFNTYTINLKSKTYSADQIVDAIKFGFYENKLGSIEPWTFSQPTWDVAQDNLLNFNYVKWRDVYDADLKSGDSTLKKREIRYYCGPDKICKGKLYINVAVRLDYNSNFNYLSFVVAVFDTDPTT